MRPAKVAGSSLLTSGTPRRLSSALRRFAVERYPGWTDGSVSLSSSEVEPLSLDELLSHADAEGRQRWESLSLGYPSHNEGSPWLRSEVASMYTGSLDPSLVNILAPQEGIFLAATALLARGDHVVCTRPHYQSLSEVARSIGCEVSAWRPEAASDSCPGAPLRFDPEALRALLRPGRTKLVVCNWPHNPTGALPTAAELGEVVDACAGCAGAPHLFIDEMYRGLEHGGAPTLPAAVDAYERGVSLGGLSKTHGLPGLRVGWLASRDAALMRRVAELKDYTTICPAAPSEALALVALRARRPLLERSRRLIAGGLATARRAVQAHPAHLGWAEPRGGTFAFVRLRGEGAPGSVEYCEALRRRANLMLMPGAHFEAPPEDDDAREAEERGGSGDAAQRVRVAFAARDTPARLERWAADLAQHGLRV